MRRKIARNENLNYASDELKQIETSKSFKLKFFTKNNILIFLFGFLTSSFIFLSFTKFDGGFSIENSSDNTIKTKKDHKLAIVVPFRDRFDELLVFVPHISKFLESKSIQFKIYIVNQVDSFRFNRASLINIGFLTSMNECDYMAMHDVDLLPLNNLLDYSYPQNGPYHVSAPGLHPEYNYSKFIGGILIISKEDFLKTNGMSNRYFGWGKEDDEFYLRLNEANLTINRPDVSKFKTKEKYTFFHNHLSDKRPRDKKRFLKQRKESLKLDRTGLDNIQYRIQSLNNIQIENYPCTIVNVELFCDKADTHWCNTEYQFFE